MNQIRPTSLKLDSSIVAGNVVSLLLAAIALWFFTTSYHGWNEANERTKLHILTGTCVFIGGLVIGSLRKQLQIQGSGALLLLSPAAFTTMGILLFSETQQYFGLIKTPFFSVTLNILGIFSGHWLRTAPGHSRQIFFKRIGALAFGGIIGVAAFAAFLVFLVSLNPGEGWQILLAIPHFVLSSLLGGLVSGFLLSRYCKAFPPIAYQIQLLFFSPISFFILTIFLFQLWKDRDTSFDSTFFFMISISSWIGSLLGWRLQAYLSKITHIEPQTQAH